MPLPHEISPVETELALLSIGFAMRIAQGLVPISWTLWGGLFLSALWGFGEALSEGNASPEVSRGLGVAVAGFLLVCLAGVGFCLFWATRRGSLAGLSSLTLLMAYPVAILIADPVVRAWKAWRFESELAEVGDFPDARSRVLAESIQSGDVARLRLLLGDGPPPAVRDRAGNDLLAFAALLVRDRTGSPETVRILLESGVDPNASSAPGDSSLLHFMIRDRTPQSIEVVRLLLEHGADPNAKDQHSGLTPMAAAGAEPELVRLLAEAGADIEQSLPDGESMLVRFIGMQQWGSALYLVERGARLDVTSPDGLSVDYYLQEFQSSVYGEHPEGWEMVRMAIEARRR